MREPNSAREDSRSNATTNYGSGTRTQIEFKAVAKLLFASALATLSNASSALAVDGVAEISHVCAVQSGCFAGDTAGYPVTIDGTGGRSYRLTSDLIVPNANTDGIFVSSSGVTIDLNGFEIVRSGCENSTTNCTPASGSGSGVARSSTTTHGISVKNGSITGMGSYGVFLEDQAEVSGLRARWNRVYGIRTGDGAIVTKNTTYQNGSAGISTLVGSTVAFNTTYNNGQNGIVYARGSTIQGNAAFDNGIDGIRGNGAGMGATVIDNTANENGVNGIEAPPGSTIARNTATNNGGDGIAALAGSVVSDNTAYSNDGDGISANVGSMVRGNAVQFNGGYGLNLSTNTSYGDNAINDNTTGTVDTGVNVGGNSCNGNTTCP